VLEIAMAASSGERLDQAAVESAIERKTLLYDKSGEEHFNLVSALHKSVRSSRPDAAVYWLARMLEAGEDRMYIARRLVRMAVEDVGLADPRAVEQAIACMKAVHFLGVPEGDQALAQTSDAAYQALNAARELVRSRPPAAVPMSLRNAPTRAMKQWGYGGGYQHAHLNEDGLTTMECMPEGLEETIFYKPLARGFEARLKERLEGIREWIRKQREAGN
jgi:putative ATPase